MSESMSIGDLSSIDWHKLWHAYGTADDVPEQLRQLASNDPATRKSAIRRNRSLHQNVGGCQPSMVI